jgi:hypothetical protein
MPGRLALGNKRWNGEASKSGLICDLEPRQYNNERAQNSIINAIGIPLKVQRNVVRKLGYFERLFDFRNWMSWQASSLQQPNSLYEWQELFSPFGHVFNGWVYIYSQGIFYCTKSAMEHFNKRQMKIYIYARSRNLNKLKLIYPKRKTDMT